VVKCPTAFYPEFACHAFESKKAGTFVNCKKKNLTPFSVSKRKT